MAEKAGDQRLLQELLLEKIKITSKLHNQIL
jgi:hypothetical protein